MQVLKATGLITMGLLYVFADTRTCDAENLFVTGTDHAWVAGRPKGKKIPGTGYCAIMIRILKATGGNDNDVKAYVFAYRSIDEDEGRYAGIVDLTGGVPIDATVKQQPSPGGGQQVPGRRETLTLQVNRNLAIHMTAVRRRSRVTDGGRRAMVMCRVKRGMAACRTDYCEEPPTDDILEEEAYDDNNSDGLPDEDPLVDPDP